MDEYEVPFQAKCPTCGFQFQGATLIAGNKKVEGSSGVCSNCGEVLRINQDHTVRPLTVSEFLSLHANDSMNILRLVSIARAEAEERKAQNRAQAN